ncbi:class D beta-lactamase [Spirillospora albida]|uniref:class D beta-lactamase n=1 Tax=Spirillospora albida TaxID=58123 RepID=UPI0006903C52|nr:class D beta-lactamase [Spirillospora albida]
MDFDSRAPTAGRAPITSRGRRGTRAVAVLSVAVPVLGACGGSDASPGGGIGTPPAAAPSTGGGTVVRDDLRSEFRRAGVQGAFVLLEAETGRMTVVDRRRAERRMIPASTFKVPHALIALETGAVRDARELIPYGGRPQRVAAWERDMNLGDAIRVSNVAVFQTIARRIGPRRERQWLDRLGYGDRQVGTAVDRFWLQGPLEISAVEQARFLARLAGRRLPASADNQRLVGDLIRIERGGDRSLHAKTGLTDATTPGTGWWVGWVEHRGRHHAFALTMDVRTDRDAGQRERLGRTLLRRLGVLG